jgi:hypothetical protein
MQNQTSFSQPSPNAEGLYGVQTWSAGPIFPAVIYVRELYDIDAQPCFHRYVMTLDGVEDVYATREDAEQAASFLLNNPTSREARRAEGGEA